MIGERTRSALAYKRQQGQPTSHPPYGFKSNGSRETMMTVLRELVIVRRILRAWRLGQSYRTIAAKLTADGVPTKQGGQWHHSTIGKVVTRREYYETLLGARWRRPLGRVHLEHLGNSADTSQRAYKA